MTLLPHLSSRLGARVRPVVLGLATLLATASALAQSPVAVATNGPSPAYLAAHARWKASLDAFEKADKAALPAEGGVLFVGSSTVRMWTNLAQDFRNWPVVINRGFGGSTMADCSLFVRDLVVRYKPSHVLVYAGDNDLAEGRTPFQVLEDFALFVNTVQNELPDTRISYISIKPSPSRAHLLPKIRETNDIIAAYLRTQAKSDFIDIFNPMLGADGQPRPELFLPDRLHMTEAGYRVWHSVIASQVQPTAGAQAATRVQPPPAVGASSAAAVPSVPAMAPTGAMATASRPH